LHYDELNDIRDQIFKVRDNSIVPMILCGNKCDLQSKREVPTDEAQKLAEVWNIPMIETSSKEQMNVEEVFFQLVREIKNRNLLAHL